ncbi:triple functional domain protein-like [Ornithodoros turicata]|uniref:triple functional domain protein-like n=1 Tax=Ornithodoros turicata TaxID=34597 RepID=UPI0031387F07
MKHSSSAWRAYSMAESYVLVMTFVDGSRLFDHVHKIGEHYSEQTVCFYMTQLLQALDYLHLCAIAHLDVKINGPSLCTAGKTLWWRKCSQRLKLIDFGSARKFVATTQKVVVEGSVEFASPEVICGNPISCKSDIWSAGVLLYVFLMGQSPFLEDDEEATCNNVIDADYMFPDSPVITDEARNLISIILVVEAEKRPGISNILSHEWMKNPQKAETLDSSLLKQFTTRRDKLIETAETLESS